MSAVAEKQEASVEESTKAFYENEGWVKDEAGVIGEDAHFRNDAEERSAYDEKCFRKPMALLEGLKGDLLIAGPGDFPKSHELVADCFDEVMCIDISERSLGICKEKLNSRGQYRLGSLLDLPVADNRVNAAMCAHVIFHIDKNDQEKAVRELIRAVKPGGRVVIVYGNPTAPLMMFQRFLKFFRVNKLLGVDKLYYFNHPRRWWRDIVGDCDVKIHPYNIMSRKQMRALLPIAPLRARAFDWASRFEDRHPETAAKLWSYIAIEINKPRG